MTEEEITQAVKVAKRSHAIGGMTVNERLYVCGLLDEFYEAKDHNKQKASMILGLLDLRAANIEAILK